MKTETLKTKFPVESSRSVTISIKRFQFADADWKCEPGTDLSWSGNWIQWCWQPVFYNRGKI